MCVCVFVCLYVYTYIDIFYYIYICMIMYEYIKTYKVCVKVLGAEILPDVSGIGSGQTWNQYVQNQESFINQSVIVC